MRAVPLRCLTPRRLGLPVRGAFLTPFVLSLGTVSAKASAPPPSATARAANAHVVPLTAPRDEFWSRRAGLLRYHCEDLALLARSRVSPSVRFVISKGPFNAVDCAAAVASLENKGCFCDEARLRCLETERIEPATFVCSGDLKCLVFEGKKKGLVRIVDVSEHITRPRCEAELKELERATEPAATPPPPAPVAPSRKI